MRLNQWDLDSPIYICEGNTNLPQKDVEIFQRLNIPYKIVKGRIWVVTSMLIYSPGDPIYGDLRYILENLPWFASNYKNPKEPDYDHNTDYNNCSDEEQFR